MEMGGWAPPARTQAEEVTLAPNHWQDGAQCLPSSDVTASEQFVTVLGVAEFPNVIKKYTVKNSQ